MASAREEVDSAGFDILTFVPLFWISFSVIFFFLCLLVKIPNIPPAIWDIMTFGKANVWGARRARFSIEKIILLPKRWFWHFYLLTIVTNGYILWLVVDCFFLGGSAPQWYITLLKLCTYYPVKEPSASHLSVLLAIAAITIQGVRRLYECFFVSTYSNSTMHVAHYLLGVFFYPLTGLTVLTEGPDLSLEVPFESFSEMLHKQLAWYHIAGTVMFLWASIHHYRAHVIFANLRKGDKDSQAHKIPYGDWFEIVSCPHYLSEVLIYVSLVVTLGGYHLLAYAMLAFVVTNQVGCGLTSHQWYQTKFEDYPKSRKAIIPWIL
ncbi:polyprenal reductase-like [Amphiura filiformis]|uniref:polyprenal reductase-like n=1 Tax=Amphiura filiformis TaxID=82378 RepID=UPI003B20DD50